jgi:hypothetical protein
LAHHVVCCGAAIWRRSDVNDPPLLTPDSRPEKMMQRSSRNDVEYGGEA